MCRLLHLKVSLLGSPAMNTRAIAVVLIIGLAIALGVALRTANRADAAAIDCYSEGQGPSEPTVCK
jgi:hypothetical protein